jgi:hypothetical protein
MSLTYKIPSYQSIYDALTTVEVPLDSIVEALFTSDLNLDDDLTGEELLYEESQVSRPKGGQRAILETPTSATYYTNSAQNIYDVCLMTVGDLDKLVLVLSSNDSIFNNINSAPEGVKAVTYNNTDVTDSGFKLALRMAGINITTGNDDSTAVQTGFLLQEDGFYLLQENGFRILL